MLPRLAAQHARDRRWIHAVLARDFSQPAVASLKCRRANSTHVILGEFGPVVCCTSPETALHRRIDSIRLCRPKEQVCRVDAAPDIAGVTQHEGFRDLAVDKLPRISVRALLLEVPVPVRLRACPKPAAARLSFINELPKTQHGISAAAREARALFRAKASPGPEPRSGHWDDESAMAVIADRVPILQS